MGRGGPRQAVVDDFVLPVGRRPRATGTGRLGARTPLLRLNATPSNIGAADGWRLGPLRLGLSIWRAQQGGRAEGLVDLARERHEAGQTVYHQSAAHRAPDHGNGAVTAGARNLQLDVAGFTRQVAAIARDSAVEASPILDIRIDRLTVFSPAAVASTTKSPASPSLPRDSVCS